MVLVVVTVRKIIERLFGEKQVAPAPPCDDFSLANPNRVRALVGSFAAALWRRSGGDEQEGTKER